MPVDPFSTSIDAMGEPYANAFEIDPQALLIGDVDLPAVSSAVWMATGGRVKVTMQGGQTVYMHCARPTLLPIRIVRVHQLDDPEQDAAWLPSSILALW